MPEFRLGSFLTPVRNEFQLKDNTNYVTAGVLSYGRGLFRRPAVKGSETSYKSYFQLRGDQFVYSKLFAWEGALAVVPANFDGLFVSQEFPIFDIDRTKADPAFVSLICQWEPFWKAVRAGETGMGGRRKRVHPAQLLEVIVLLPPLAQQMRIVDLVNSLDETLGTAVLARIAGDATYQSLADDLIFKSNAEWPAISVGDLAANRGLVGGPFGSSLVMSTYTMRSEQGAWCRLFSLGRVRRQIRT
jgi:type I restriction enzyme S subunit